MPRPVRPAPADAAEAKALAAEKDIAVIRLVVILFNVVTYYAALPKGHDVPWLAHTVSVVATSYGVGVVAFQPYHRFPILRAALFTALTDGALIALWVHATGGYHSPFYLLWFLSLVAVAFRYEWKATLFATFLYIAAYVAVVGLRGELAGHRFDMLVRCVYILLSGTVGSLLAYESAQVFGERARMARDVERERQEHAAREIGRLEESARFKTEFINAAAHELNTPLTPLRLQLEALRRAPPGHDRDRALAIMDRNVERIAFLVQDMLDAARLQSGHLVLERADADLAVLVREVVDTYAGTAAEKRVSVHVDGPPAAPCRLDAKRVTQILYNLLSNAVKYTPRGGTVTVRYGMQGGDAVLEVEDTGVGFSAEQAQRLFLPFSQVHRDQLAVPGTGLGLFISRGIAERHGGTLEASSPGPGKGARFRCVVPARD